MPGACYIYIYIYIYKTFGLLCQEDIAQLVVTHKISNCEILFPSMLHVDAF